MICQNKECGQEFPHYVWHENQLRQLSRRKFCLDCKPYKARGGVGKTFKGFSTHTEYAADKRRSLKERALEYKGGCCERCGFDESLAALCFHHRNHDEKEAQISDLIKRFASWERIENELDKCDLLCLNCHAIEHELILTR